MKIFVTILFSFLAATFASAEDLFTLTFSNKTATGITTTAEATASFTGTMSAGTLSLTRSVETGDAIMTAASSGTAPAVATNNNVLTPNVNIGNGGTWTVDVPITVDSGAMTLSGINIVAGTFGVSGYSQSATKTAKLTVSVFEQGNSTALAQGNATAECAGAFADGVFSVTFDSASLPMLSAEKTYILRIFAERVTESGFFLALKNITAAGTNVIIPGPVDPPTPPPTTDYYELLTLAFSDKTGTEITVNSISTGYSGTFGCELTSLKKTVYNGGAVSDVGFMTEGSPVGTNTTFFTPNTNVQNSGSWTAEFSCTATGSMVLGNVVLKVISFGSTGSTQGALRAAEFSFTLLDANGNSIATGTVAQPITNGTTPNDVKIEFSEAPIISAGNYTMRILATKSTETSGSYFALTGIVANGLDSLQEIFEPSGYVLKSIPAGKSTFISINVQKPVIVQTAASFAVDGGTGTVTMTADSDVNFATLLDSSKSYLLEVELSAGTAVFILNRDIWKDGETAQFSATLNTLVFDSEELVIFLNGETSAKIRIREAWTLDEIFGAAFRAGELKRGNAISGDAVYVNIDYSGNALKTYFTLANAWKGNAAYASQPNIGLIPIHPCSPLQIVRKAGVDCELQLLGDVFSGDRFVRVNNARERLSAADAFPQVLGSTGMELENPKSITIGTGSFKYNSVDGVWEFSSGGADASGIPVDDGLLFIRSETTPEFILFKQSTLR